MRPVQRPDLVDETAAAFQLALEIRLRNDAMMLGIAAILGPVAWRRGELLPVCQVVAGENRHTIVRAVYRCIDAPVVVTHRSRDGPATQDEVFAPRRAFIAQHGGTLGRADYE